MKMHAGIATLTGTVLVGDYFYVATGESRVYARGLRNPVGMAWQPQTGELWVAGR